MYRKKVMFSRTSRLNRSHSSPPLFVFAVVNDEPVQSSLVMCTLRIKVEAGCLSWSFTSQAMIVAGVKGMNFANWWHFALFKQVRHEKVLCTLCSLFLDKALIFWLQSLSICSCNFVLYYYGWLPLWTIFLENEDIHINETWLMQASEWVYCCYKWSCLQHSFRPCPKHPTNWTNTPSYSCIYSHVCQSSFCLICLDVYFSCFRFTSLFAKTKDDVFLSIKHVYSKRWLHKKTHAENFGTQSVLRARSLSLCIFLLSGWSGCTETNVVSSLESLVLYSVYSPTCSDILYSCSCLSMWDDNKLALNSCSYREHCLTQY